MKVKLPALLLGAGWICVLAGHPAYGVPLKAGNERLETYLEKLRANIIEEEKAVESLKKRYEDILKKKQNLKQQKTQREESKKPDTSPGEGAAPDSKLKTLESTQYSLKQKNQELKKNKTIDELKKAGTVPPKTPKKEKASIRQAECKSHYPEKDAAVKKQADKLQKEKAALEGQLKALKEENKNLLARKPVRTHPAKEIYTRQKKEIKENTFSKKSVDSKGLDTSRTSCVGLSQKDTPGILKGFIGKARNLDSWWRKKVW